MQKQYLSKIHFAGDWFCNNLFQTYAKLKRSKVSIDRQVGLQPGGFIMRRKFLLADRWVCYQGGLLGGVKLGFYSI